MLRYVDNMQRETRFFHGYLLITSGPRHVPDMKKEPAARTQMRVLQQVALKADAELNIVTWDYARKIRSLDDVPNLFKALRQSKQAFESGQSRGRISIDSYSRLFSVTTPEMQRELWLALLEYDDYIRDIQTKKRLTQLSREIELLVKSGNMPPLKLAKQNTQRSEAERQAQTSNAREYSVLVRGQRAKRAAQNLREAYNVYKEETRGGSLKGFIESDASKELLNSRGKPWVYGSAKRAIRDLKSDET